MANTLEVIIMEYRANQRIHTNIDITLYHYNKIINVQSINVSKNSILVTAPPNNLEVGNCVDLSMDFNETDDTENFIFSAFVIRKTESDLVLIIANRNSIEKLLNPSQSFSANQKIKLINGVPDYIHQI